MTEFTFCEFVCKQSNHKLTGFLDLSGASPSVPSTAFYMTAHVRGLKMTHKEYFQIPLGILGPYTYMYV